MIKRDHRRSVERRWPTGNRFFVEKNVGRKCKRDFNDNQKSLQIENRNFKRGEKAQEEGGNCLKNQ